jgi:hypothetical protein
MLVAALATSTAGAQSFSEGFDDITTLAGAGWAFINNSDTAGTTSWDELPAREGQLTRGATEFQGNPDVFPAHMGAPSAYIADNYNATGSGTISDWLLTPEFCFIDGDTVSFWTRTVDGSTYPDRLEVRLSGSGASTDVGSTSGSVGDFTTVLAEVNPGLVAGGYPETWTEISATITGFPSSTCGRLGFRYYVDDGGPFGANSNFIGVDTLEVVSSVPVELMSFSVE